MGYRVPAFSYPGGKVKLREWLVRQMPTSGGKYVEPFAGRGNVFWLAVHMLDYKEWWLNDPWTARWFEAIQRVDLRSIPEELTRLLARMYLRSAVEDRKNDDVAVALEEIMMFSGGAKCGLNSRWKRQPKLESFKRKLKQARAILNSVSPKITSLEWEECHMETLSENDFTYLDPPYEDARKDLYHHDTVHHEDLLAYLLDTPHLWMLSGYKSPMYTRYLGTRAAERVSRMSMHQQHGSRVQLRRECIWTNYTLDARGIPKRKRLKQRRIRKKKLPKS